MVINEDGSKKIKIKIKILKIGRRIKVGKKKGE